MQKLPRDFYGQDAITVARKLLGKYLVHNVEGEELAGKIVEVEAYMGPEDKAAHSYNYRRTQRTEIMYGPAGYVYVFRIYGMYNCINVVTAEVDKPQVVLIRALEPVSGLDKMSVKRYGKKYSELKKSQIINLTNGPGKLCMAMEINMSNYGDDLCGDRLYIAEGSTDDKFDIVSSKRINIDYAEEAADYPWRFYIKGNPFVSKPHI
ncbi:MAG TPA: DNA-3-methyladenine glycosylase [Clostridiaceae bacterium]|nr:DNA-3-methyladenine glycosylase [Clostridiaceae bacterium]